MNRIKDWFYNYSDIFAGILITAVAGLVIFASVSDIMSFSDSFQVLAKDSEDDNSVKIHTSSSSGGLIDVVDGEGEDDGSNGAGTSTSSAISGGAVSTPTSQGVTTGSATDNSQQTPNTIRTRVTIIIPSGSTGSKVAQLLKDNGLITDTNDFLSILSSSNLDSKLRSGTFSIPQGSSVTEIINILTGNSTGQ